MTTSSRDLFAIAVAVSGLIAVGPAQLFFPNTAAMVFGPKIWLAIFLLYYLVVTLITLMVRPSLVVYGRTAQEVFPALLRACQRIDPSSAGDAASLEVHLKTVQLRLRCDGDSRHDAVRIVSFAPAFGPDFWNRLLGELRGEQIDISPGRPVGGGWAMAIAVGGLLFAISYALATPTEVVADFKTWLWR